MRFRCRVCKRRVTIVPVYSRDNRQILFSCPNCLSQGIFRNKDYVPVLFVRKISLASRQQFFGVLNPSHRKMGDARRGFKPPTINSL